MKQFNLEEYLKDPNKKVVTRDGRNVRIICTDRQGGDHPILALCTMGNESENLYSYLPNGRMYLSAYADSCTDLFFAPKKHEGWVNLYKGNACYSLGSTILYQSESEAKRIAKDCDYVGTIKVEWEE